MVSVPSKYTIMLDIDMTSFLGQDGNDIPCCLQKDGRAHILPALMPLLVNPAMVTAVRAIEQRLGDVRVVLYTAKADLVTVMAHTSSNAFSAGEKDLYFPKHTQVEHLPPLPDDHARNKFRRLFLTRDAICGHLQRDSVEIVVTSRPGKCVVRTCGLLSPPAEPENAYLFDDRVDLAGQYHVITVPEFNAVTDACKDAIYKVIGPAPLSKAAAAYASTGIEGHRCLGGLNRIVVNYTTDAPKEWSLSFLDLIEHMIFRFTSEWMDVDSGLDDEDGFDPCRILAAVYY
jgi:hypothetical protein